ncbi:hypothetical protein Droror1_Dr00019708 [Drosera rotundifolia]
MFLVLLRKQRTLKNAKTAYGLLKKANQSADERRREEEEKRRFDSAKAECASVEKAQVEARERAKRAAVLRAQEDEDEENNEDEDESGEGDEDEDISFFTNRAAVYLARGKYDECIQGCDKVVERYRELRSDYKMNARALTRKGTTLAKMAKSSKDYDVAIEVFQKALTEHCNPDTLKKLDDAERAKKELEQQEYYDPQIADEECEKGNEFFKKQKYPEAIKHYTEAIKRNPKDHKAYSNKAASYTKLGAMLEGLKDAEKCIELDPTFAKGYTRKGAVQFFMKEYDKALETYQEGLKHEPNNPELLDGVKRCVQQINKASRGDLSLEELKERQAKAMQDPEIQNILTDPVMRQVLIDFQENPKAAQEHIKNPSSPRSIKLSPVCLRVDPLPKKRQGARSKAEREEKELQLLNHLKATEEEVSSMNQEVVRLRGTLKEVKDKAHAADGESHSKTELMETRSAVTSLSEALEAVQSEIVKSRDNLFDKEKECICEVAITCDKFGGENQKGTVDAMEDGTYSEKLEDDGIKGNEDAVPMKDQENATVAIITAEYEHSQPTGVQKNDTVEEDRSSDVADNFGIKASVDHDILKVVEEVGTKAIKVESSNSVVIEEIDGENSVKDCDVSNDEEEVESALKANALEAPREHESICGDKEGRAS